MLLAAGLLAKKAVEKGLTVKRAHQDVARARLARRHRLPRPRPDCCPISSKLGFGVAAYGCTTCIGNAGDLTPEINEAITANDLVCAAVLSGNRNFEARIHPNLKANFLASPPLVVAYAIAGTVLRDLTTEPLGKGKDGAGLPEGHLADVARDRRGDAVRARSGDLPHALRRPRERQSAVGHDRRRERAGLSLAAVDATSRSRRSSTASR